jgi:hypothetical protein
MLLGKWDVEVNGHSHVVSVERAQTGKDVIRVNGRVAAKPMAEEDNERTVSVGGFPYTLRFTKANGYELDVDELGMAEAQARTMETANAVLAHGNAPVNIKRDSFFRHLPKLGYLAVVAGVVGLMYMLQGPGYDKIAQSRVRRVLTEMNEMKESQFAVTYWFKNKKVLDNSEMSIASDRFDKWRQKKGLYRKIDNFEILTTDYDKKADPNVAVVHFKIEGTEYAVKVPKDLQIEWVE